MPKLRFAVITAVFALVGVTPAFSDGYYGSLKDYGAAPAPDVIEAPAAGYVLYGPTEVEIGYRGPPPYGYRAGYFDGPPILWRQRDAAFDAAFTEDKRIVYDAGRAAQTRAVVGRYGPSAYYGPPAATPEPFVDPAGSCGTFRYWDGAGCVDARFHSRYKNPYAWKYLRK